MIRLSPSCPSQHPIRKKVNEMDDMWITETCRYELDESKPLPFPRVGWIGECGYRLALLEGYNVNYINNPAFDNETTCKYRLPTGLCSKCGRVKNICIKKEGE